jgi:hypothetical protein
MAEKSLVMIFLNQLGARATVTVPGIRDDITEQEVSVVMDSIVPAIYLSLLAEI